MLFRFFCVFIELRCMFRCCMLLFFIVAVCLVVRVELIALKDSSQSEKCAE